MELESVTSMLGDWNSFNGVNVGDEAYFMSQLLDKFSVPNESQNSSPFEVSSTFWPNYEVDHETWVHLPQDNDLSASSKKRSSSMADVYENVEKRKCRKSQKLVSNNNKDEGDNDAVFGQTMKIYGSDEDSNWSQDSISPRPKQVQILKTRASRGTATDPQSVYARKRRERINERLRILQNLVPNGTKVDISTMLEEAVEYVKFLQLQIKLLSSDDMWMYAPIAYNGMDIGLDLKTISSLSPS
ncbi:transcription factor bHLH84 [Lactuca sativa]|uniref:BHLH domain-containing protein n=1 Tax=Lactuca sativa TaxID=4236 RepID=A0A9R1VGB4_LACSA|nr:transcription factor bHLH84 [Lactuca sativa]KAJ0205846.1 hypothetical protein LSAT_V11C500269520 [Lactuca sativa]